MHFGQSVGTSDVFVSLLSSIENQKLSSSFDALNPKEPVQFLTSAVVNRGNGISHKLIRVQVRSTAN